MIMFLDLVVSFVGVLVLWVMVLVGVAFLTLLERSVLGYIQVRSGPNKVGLLGVLQPFSDAISLFTSEQVVPSNSNYLPYYFSPVYLFFLSLISWLLFPYFWGLNNFHLGLLFLLVVLSVGVYGVMISGWSSCSLYSVIGGLRCVVQTISYEVSLAFIMICIFVLLGSYSLLDLVLYQSYMYFFFFMLPLALIMIVSLMAEVNRTPFDFAEAESELVSGFNVEYASGGFALIFLGEYSMILFMSMLYVVFFLGGNAVSWWFFVSLVVLSFFFVWVRGSLPRYRYDKLMLLCWKSFLGFSLGLLMFFLYFWVFIYFKIL